MDLRFPRLRHQLPEKLLHRSVLGFRLSVAGPALPAKFLHIDVLNRLKDDDDDVDDGDHFRYNHDHDHDDDDDDDVDGKYLEAVGTDPPDGGITRPAVHATGFLAGGSTRRRLGLPLVSLGRRLLDHLHESGDGGEVGARSLRRSAFLIIAVFISRATDTAASGRENRDLPRRPHRKNPATRERDREREIARFLDFAVLAFLVSVYLVCRRTYSRKSGYFLARGRATIISNIENGHEKKAFISPTNGKVISGVDFS